MKRALVEILACPVCKGKLKLNVEAEGGGEIFAGNLYCDRCRISYPIEDTIPTLLPPQKTEESTIGYPRGPWKGTYPGR
ncbi:MAG: methytransferase partner Trm112 [Dehalococcoidales bacterium]|nr:methytransferase partner Trm112 [Dehalococcoidales bacterium]